MPERPCDSAPVAPEPLHTLDIPLNLDNVVVAPGMTCDGQRVQRMADIMSETCIVFA